MNAERKRGSQIERKSILKRLRATRQRLVTIDDQAVLCAAHYLGQEIAWIEKRAKRTANRVGGMGRK